MGWFRKKADPISDRARALNDQIAQLEAQIRHLDDRLARKQPSPNFGQYHLADKLIQSLLFRVGGVPRTKWDAVRGDITKLPSLHSPFWAPDPEPTIAAATEAMTAAALTVLARSR